MSVLCLDSVSSGEVSSVTPLKRGLCGNHSKSEGFRERKYCSFCRELNPNSAVVKPVAEALCRLSYLVSCLLYILIINPIYAFKIPSLQVNDMF